MIDQSMVQEYESSQTQDIYKRKVVDSAFLRIIIDHLKGVDVIKEAASMHGNPRHSAVYVFSAEHDHNSFSTMMDYALGEEGIAREPEFEIVSKGGMLVVNCEHPEKDRLELVLKQNSDIYEAFKRMYSSYARIASLYIYQKTSGDGLVKRRTSIGKYLGILSRRRKGCFSVWVSSRGYEPRFIL